jgi:Zn ribbon nucleic-acid-binding protein
VPKTITIKGKAGTLKNCPRCKRRESYVLWADEHRGHCFACGLNEKFNDKKEKK